MKRIKLLGLSILICVLFSGCSVEDISLNLAVSSENGGKIVHEARNEGEYDSMDVSIVASVSTINKTITFYSFELKKYFTLNYNAYTRFADKYDVAVSVNQLKPGILAEVSFYKADKILVSLKESSECFKIDDVTGFSVNTQAGIFNYKSEAYEITDATIVLGGDELKPEDLDGNDNVMLVGNDSVLYCITVNKGHGFLSLKGEDYFIGGFLEIGNQQILKISEDLLLTLTEGEYRVKVSQKETEAIKTVSVKPGETTVLNLGDIEIVEPKKGRVCFETTPEALTLYIDDKEVDYSRLLSFEYGKHKLVASAEGYETITRYFIVGEESATLKVILDKTEKEDDTKEEEKKPATDGYYVFVNNPLEVEVYADNYYIGLAPTMFAKTAGTHVITLKKNGYVTKTYTINIPDTEGDLNYSFESMEPVTNVDATEANSTESEG